MSQKEKFALYLTPEMKARLERRYTEDGSRPQGGHMGMGLYFASQIAQKHGGCLSLENTSTGGKACLWLKR